MLLQNALVRCHRGVPGAPVLRRLHRRDQQQRSRAVVRRLGRQPRGRVAVIGVVHARHDRGVALERGVAVRTLAGALLVLPGDDDGGAVRMRRQRGGDGSEQSADETAAPAGAHDGELRPRGEVDEHAGGVALLGMQLDLAGIAGELLAGLREHLFRGVECGDVLGHRGHRGHVDVDHRRHRVRSDDGEAGTEALRRARSVVQRLVRLVRAVVPDDHAERPGRGDIRGGRIRSADVVVVHLNLQCRGFPRVDDDAPESSPSPTPPW